MSIQNWEQLIEQEEAKGTFDTLRPYLDQAYKEQIIYPAKENIFRALEMTPLDKVRVVILGQDPYHGPNQAQGFSFSVPANEKSLLLCETFIRRSLTNIRHLCNAAVI